MPEWEVTHWLSNYVLLIPHGKETHLLKGLASMYYCTLARTILAHGLNVSTRSSLLLERGDYKRNTSKLYVFGFRNIFGHSKHSLYSSLCLERIKAKYGYSGQFSHFNVFIFCTVSGSEDFWPVLKRSVFLI